ncbi:glycosyltransferase family 2 protein [Klebsiella quasipneumoniae]|uniref:glycosyltransferase family 2 protein n=1 Tax=Klebsiella quasipneumoniae TaxID=1463165 RepID=UPI00277BB068|nr:glycosyltransferase family 2 protein [Klebsiella quasipneumoniae subsp. similipneumoniae]
MVYIVVLNWNGLLDTLSCLNSLLELQEEKFKVVICDNGSSDGSVLKIMNWHNELKEGLKERFPINKIDLPVNFSSIKTTNNSGIYLINIGKNLGYAGGNNVGINFALSQNDMSYVWLLNNDTEVDPHSLLKMKEAFSKDKKIGICGSRLVYFSERDKLQGLGGVFNPLFCSSYHYKANENATIEFDDEVISNSIDYVIGASMLISAEALNDIGVLCEDYFLYYEEIDYCLRAKNLGYRIYCATESIVYHKEGASTQKGILSDYFWVRNRILIAKKYYPAAILPVYLSLFVTFFNRIRRMELSKAKNVLKIIFGSRDLYNLK